MISNFIFIIRLGKSGLILERSFNFFTLWNKKVKVPFLNFSTYHEKFRIIFENVTKLEITSKINQPMILL